MMHKPQSHFLNRRKISIYFLLSALVLGIIACLFLQIFLKNKIEKSLSEDLPPNMQLVYKELEFNLLSKKIGLTDIHLTLTKDIDTITMATIAKIMAKGISYTDLVWSGNVEVDHVIVDAIDATYFLKNDTVKNGSELKGKPFHKIIRIKNFEIKNSNFETKTIPSDSTISKLEHLNLKLTNCIIDQETLATKIPFSYDSYSIRTGAIFYNANAFEVIQMDSLAIDKETLISGFSLKTKFNKHELQAKLLKERDYIDLKIPTIEIEGLDFGFQNDTFFVAIISGKMKNLKLEMYRNKLLPDDLLKKPMFMETWHKLPIAITIPDLQLENGSISYSELVKENTQPGEIFFTEVHTIITNISNTSDQEITFKNKAKLMGIAPITLDWSFYTKEAHNLFKAHGVIKDFETESVNPFLKSNLRAEARGAIDELYFTISGDDYTSTGDMKMKYHDFGFVVLQKDRLGVNKLLTAIGNIFTNDGSKTDENGYRYGDIEVERNPTKSFFNYLWINVKDGILSTFTSNGKKKDK